MDLAWHTDVLCMGWVVYMCASVYEICEATVEFADGYQFNAYICECKVINKLLPVIPDIYMTQSYWHAISYFHMYMQYICVTCTSNAHVSWILYHMYLTCHWHNSPHVETQEHRCSHSAIDMRYVDMRYLDMYSFLTCNWNKTCNSYTLTSILYHQHDSWLRHLHQWCNYTTQGPCT